MTSRELAERELRETAQLLLTAMAAEERMRTLDPHSTTILEGTLAAGRARELHAAAMARFKVMCWRLACAGK